MEKLLLTILAICFIGCSATNTVTMSMMEPAPVELPPSMQRVGVIDRSQPTDKKQILDKVDQVLSVEGVNLDKDGALQSITGLSEELKKNERFEEVVVLEDEELGNPKFGVLPSPLPWDRITELCRENRLDGLFSLEFYDTDSKVNYDAKKVSLKGPLGIKIPALEHHARATTVIKTGWRIYDTHGRNIVDEYVINESITTTGTGINPVEAVSAITGRKEAVQQISNEIGQSYALNIVPFWTRVRREYYVKGNDSFKIAKRRAQTGNWDGAAELWQKEINNPKAKIAGRAHYNMAIISEINGEIDQAMDWARKAYEDYNNKLALRYLNILENRQARVQVLNRQQQWE